jgi:dimethylargininase
MHWHEIPMPMIALTHVPSPNMQACERTYVEHSPIDYDRALRQHAAYRRTLVRCGCEVRTLDINAQLPDCVFIEDTAVILDEVALVTSMGAAARRGESAAIEPALREFRAIEKMEPPAALEGGDVLRVGRTLLVGQSKRTNSAGIERLSQVAKRFGYRVHSVPVRGCLHLKTACGGFPDGRLLINPAWIDAAILHDFSLVHVPKGEPWGANFAVVDQTVLVAAAHQESADLISGLGFPVETVDITEFARAEGGVTCLALFIS